MNDATAQSVAIARKLLVESLWGSLGTLADTGAPFTSLVAIATGPDSAPVMLLSRLALHTANILRDPRASLLLAAGKAQPHPLAAERLTLSGTVSPASDQAACATAFLASHPEARGFSRFSDFAYYRLEIEAAHLVAGFGRIEALDPTLLTGLRNQG